jgi:hypothetical protein
VGPLGVAVAGRRVAVGVAGRLVGAGGTVVGVGVSVTSGVGVIVGVSVGVGVGVSTGVGVWVDVGVKVGLGVLVGVDVAVGDPMNDVREQPRALIMTSMITSVEVIVAASFLPVIVEPADPLSPRKPCSWQYDKPKRELEDLPPLERSPPRRASPTVTPGGRATRHSRICGGRLCLCADLSMRILPPVDRSLKAVLGRPDSSPQPMCTRRKLGHRRTRT